jgi:hypothetical protein
MGIDFEYSSSRAASEVKNAQSGAESAKIRGKKTAIADEGFEEDRGVDDW